MILPNRRKILLNNIPESVQNEGYSFGDIDVDWIYCAMEEYANAIYKHRVNKFNLVENKNNLNKKK